MFFFVRSQRVHSLAIRKNCAWFASCAAPSWCASAADGWPWTSSSSRTIRAEVCTRPMWHPFLSSINPFYIISFLIMVKFLIEDANKYRISLPTKPLPKKINHICQRECSKGNGHTSNPTQTNPIPEQKTTTYLA